MTLKYGLSIEDIDKIMNKNPNQEILNIQDPINTSDNVSSIIKNTVKPEIIRIYNDFIPILSNI